MNSIGGHLLPTMIWETSFKRPHASDVGQDLQSQGNLDDALKTCLMAEELAFQARQTMPNSGLRGRSVLFISDGRVRKLH